MSTPDPDELMEVALARLKRFLRQRPGSQTRIGVELPVIEEVMRQPLPPAAKAPGWWDNHGPQSNSWLEAGWVVDQVIPGRAIAFSRRGFAH